MIGSPCTRSVRFLKQKRCFGTVRFLETLHNIQPSATWWWNDEVAKVIKEKQRLYKLYEKSKKDEDRNRVEELRRTYQIAKCDAKKAVYKAQEEERKEFGEMLENEDKKGTGVVLF